MLLQIYAISVSRKALGAGVYDLLKGMADAPISYLAAENTPEVEVGGRTYALGCGLSHQVRNL